MGEESNFKRDGAVCDAADRRKPPKRADRIREKPRAMKRFALVILAVALLAGAGLRFDNLGARQMSADEGATWAAADAPSIGEVIALQQTHDPGKLPLHDLMLHGWIAIFGDGLFAMRSLGALFGLATIVLMVPLTREIFLIPMDGEFTPFSESDLDLIAVLSALISAVSLMVIKYDRDARMYGPMLAIAVAHLWFFLRSLRRQSLPDYVMLALLSSVAIAINPVILVMFAVEAIWLVAAAVSRRIQYGNRVRAAFASGGAIAAGLVILAPALYAPFHKGHQAFSSGNFDWLVAPPWWEPAAFFNRAAGSVAFPMLCALAAWGVWRTWRQARGAVAFALLVMWAPPIILVAGSLLWRPIFVERYAIYSFPPFFILIGVGIWQLGNNIARVAATGAVVAVSFGLSLGHIYFYSQKMHNVDWREAARVAQTSLRPADTIAVAPPYAVEVVRYYANPGRRTDAVGYDGANNNSSVAILGECCGVNPAVAAQVQRDYPHLLERATGVVVLSR